MEEIDIVCPMLDARVQVARLSCFCQRRSMLVTPFQWNIFRNWFYCNCQKCLALYANNLQRQRQQTEVIVVIQCAHTIRRRKKKQKNVGLSLKKQKVNRWKLLAHVVIVHAFPTIAHVRTSALRLQNPYVARTRPVAAVEQSSDNFATRCAHRSIDFPREIVRSQGRQYICIVFLRLLPGSGVVTIDGKQKRANRFFNFSISIAGTKTLDESKHAYSAFVWRNCRVRCAPVHVCLDISMPQRIALALPSVRCRTNIFVFTSASRSHTIAFTYRSICAVYIICEENRHETKTKTKQKNGSILFHFPNECVSCATVAACSTRSKKCSRRAKKRPEFVIACRTCTYPMASFSIELACSL